MDMDLIKQFFLSPLGFFLGVFVKSYLASLFICIGGRLSGYKNIPLKIKYIFCIFFLILGIRLAFFSIFSQFSG